jgi:hypothetical protein
MVLALTDKTVRQRVAGELISGSNEPETSLNAAENKNASGGPRRASC